MNNFTGRNARTEVLLSPQNHHAYHHVSLELSATALLCNHRYTPPPPSHTPNPVTLHAPPLLVLPYNKVDFIQRTMFRVSLKHPSNSPPLSSSLPSGLIAIAEFSIRTPKHTRAKKRGGAFRSKTIRNLLEGYKKRHSAKRGFWNVFNASQFPS